MKILVLGDIHGRTCWKEIITKEQPDKVIFLGDYVSTHMRISDDEQINNFKQILQFKEQNKKDVVLLRGNHDMQHLMGNIDSFECSGYFPIVAKWFQKHYEQIIKDTQWVEVIDNYLFSHAGISETWFKDVPAKDYNDINKLPPSELFGFRPSSIWDCYGDTKTQGCTWIRPEALARDCIIGYTQVVGHTIVENITDVYKASKKNQHIILCDCLPKQYVIIQDGKLKVVVNENNDKLKRNSDTSSKEKQDSKQK